MNKLILCEGKTDAILLSYYLEKTCGWSHRNAVKHLEIKADETKNESAYWYKRSNENLLICGVGGKDSFGAFFKDKIHEIMINADAFSKIAVVTDRDDRQISSICDSLLSAFGPVATSAECNFWRKNSYTNSFGQQVSVDYLLLVVPHEKEGALESILLDAISEDAYDKVIVDKSKEYVESVVPCASKYIAKPRLRLKACLGVSWAIQYPEKVFLLMDEQIRSVKWEQSEILNECFSELKKI